MKCQILFSRKNKKSISKCRLLKFLPGMQRAFSSSIIVYSINYYTRPFKHKSILTYTSSVNRASDQRLIYLLKDRLEQTADICRVLFSKLFVYIIRLIYAWRSFVVKKEII